MGSSPFGKISWKKTLIKVELHLFNLIFFVVYGHIDHGHVSPFVLHLFMASQLLVLEKQIDSIWPIMIGKVTLLISHPTFTI